MSEGKLIYISGPMNGIPDLNRAQFAAYVKELNALGFRTLNPHDVPPLVNPPSYDDYLMADLRALVLCDALLFLPGYIQSTGAKVEGQLAAIIGMPMFSSVKQLQEYTWSHPWRTYNRVSVSNPNAALFISTGDSLPTIHLY